MMRPGGWGSRSGDAASPGGDQPADAEHRDVTENAVKSVSGHCEPKRGSPAWTTKLRPPQARKLRLRRNC